MKKILSLVIVFVALALGSSALAATFGTNNLVIYRIGDGTEALGSSTGNTVFVDEYTTNGAFVQSIMIRTNYYGANSPLIASGVASADGLLTRSVDGRFIVLGGYGATLAQLTNFALASTSATEVPRVVGLVDGSANIDTTTAETNSLFSTGVIRSPASTDGTNIWSATDINSILYTTRGYPVGTQVTSFVTTLRQLHIFSRVDTNGFTGNSTNQLYFSDASGSIIRIGVVTNGLPTSPGAIMASLTGLPTTVGSPYGFVLLKLSGGTNVYDTLYYADDATGIYKYSLVGSAWTSNGFFTASNVRGLTGVYDGSKVRLYMTTAPTAPLPPTPFSGGGNFLGYTDTAGYNAAPTGNGGDIGDFADFNVTPGGSRVFRGIAFSPVGGETFPSGPGQISVGPILGLFSGGLTGCSFPSTQKYSVANVGTISVSWSATGDVNWVSLSPSGGTLTSGGSVTVTASFNANANSLSAGTNTATITFTNTTSAPNNLGTTTRAVRLIVNDQQINPSSDYSIAGQPGGPFSPTNKVYTITNGATAINWTVSKTANWIDLSSTSGSVAGCSSISITVSVNSANANALAAGNYSDVLSFSNNSAATLLDTRAVNLSAGSVYFCDDFGSAPFITGDLVGQQAWVQQGGSVTLPLQITNGVVRVPDGTTGDNQDSYKNFPQNYNTSVFAGMVMTITSACTTSQTPSYVAAIYNFTNAGGFANYRFSAQDADGTGTNTFKFSARTTGLGTTPWTNGAAALSYNTAYRVIIKTDPLGTNVTVYVNPTSDILGAQTPYLATLYTGVALSSLATNVGSFVISQFQNAGAFPVGARIAKVCINTNYADVYNSITTGGPSDPYTTWTTYYGLSAGNALGTADPDGDGVSNTNEFLSGFNPTNSSARVRVISVAAQGNDEKVTYLGSNGDSNGSPGPKTNVLEFTAGTANGSYTNNYASTGQTNILTGGTGLGQQTNMIDSGGATNTPSRYYRVRVLTP